MSKIDAALLQKTEENGPAAMRVLVTLKDGAALPPALDGKGRFVLEGKVFAAAINSEGLQALAQNDDVEAIEPDGEMGIL